MKNFKPWRTAVVLMASTAIAAIQMPASYGNAGNVEEELLESYIKTVLVYTGNTSWTWWHLFTNFPNITYMQFRDVRTGLTHKVYTEDTIKVRFSDGSKLKMYLVGPGAPSGNFFQVLDGSQRKPDGTRYFSHDGCRTRECRGDHIGEVTAVSAPIYTASWTWGTTETELQNW